MKVENIDITKSIELAKDQIANDKTASPALKSTFSLLLLIISLLINKLGLNSSNSSIPPSQDPNRPKIKKKKKRKGKRLKPGGQKGHAGSTLEKFSDPNEIVPLEIDRRTIPPGKYKNVGLETRQVVDINISLHVTEYQAEILEDKKGNRYVAEFPKGLTKAIQYGPDVKGHAVYMSQFQLIPYDRVREHFENQVGISLSTGSLVNFNKEAFELLEHFEKWAKSQLLVAKVNHADETGINVNGKKVWLHTLTNEKVTLFYPHVNRGKEAMDEMGILPKYMGTLCHDHWRAYYAYDQCTHSLCNAHHIRELDRAWEQDNQKWAKNMEKFLQETNIAVIKAGGALSEEEAIKYRKRYRNILTRGEKECPENEKEIGKRGQQKQSKSRNLLNRLRNFEDDVLRFMTDKMVPFTNNLGENDIRMTKVQQKISGSFRSIDGANIFCRIRSYLISSRKNGISPSKAVSMLFKGKLPSFIT